MSHSIRAAGVLAVVLLMGAAAPVAAQGFEWTAAYQFQRLTCGDCGDPFNMPAGFYVDVARRIMPNLHLVGQSDWSRKRESETFGGTRFESTSTLSTFGAGARWMSQTSPKATPFIQALVGVTHESDKQTAAGFSESHSENNRMVQFGGGVTVPVSGNIGVVGQLDYRRIFTEDQGVNSIRFVAGIRIR